MSNGTLVYFFRMTDVSTGEYRSKGTITDQFVIAHHGAVSSIRIFSASQLMVSGGYDKRVMIWNINDQLAKELGLPDISDLKSD